MRSFTLVLWFMGVVVLATGSALANTIWDPTASYSNVNNPDGAWSYGWMNNSQFQLFTSNGPDPGPLPGWYGPLNGLVPYQQRTLSGGLAEHGFASGWCSDGAAISGTGTRWRGCYSTVDSPNWRGRPSQHPRAVPAGGWGYYAG